MGVSCYYHCDLRCLRQGCLREVKGHPGAGRMADPPPPPPIMRAIMRAGLENILGRGPGGAEDRGRAAAHWARARMPGIRKAPRTRRRIVWGNQGYSGEDKHLAQPDPAGDACCVRDRRLLRASISERHLAFQSLIHFTFRRVAGIFPFTIEELRAEGEVTHQQDQSRTEMALPGTTLGTPRPASAQPHLPGSLMPSGSAEFNECPEPTFLQSQGPRSEY